MRTKRKGKGKGKGSQEMGRAARGDGRRGHRVGRRSSRNPRSVSTACAAMHFSCASCIIDVALHVLPLTHVCCAVCCVFSSSSQQCSTPSAGEPLSPCWSRCVWLRTWTLAFPTMDGGRGMVTRTRLMWCVEGLFPSCHVVMLLFGADLCFLPPAPPPVLCMCCSNGWKTTSRIRTRQKIKRRS